AERPEKPDLPNLLLPKHHDVRPSDLSLRRLHGNLAAAANRGPVDFIELLLTPGVGARTIRALALVAEVVHGYPYRFNDPARFSLAHGGKDGHPFPVPLRVYDETIQLMEQSIQKAKLGNTDKNTAIKNLSHVAEMLEENFIPEASIDKLINHERNESYKYDGRTVFGKAKKPKPIQLTLF